MGDWKRRALLLRDVRTCAAQAGEADDAWTGHWYGALSGGACAVVVAE
jgi:hypothetical protein